MFPPKLLYLYWISTAPVRSYAHFGQQANGIINCDRYSAYKKLTNLNGGLVKTSLSEAIFSKRVRLIHHLQHSAFIDESYQTIRTGLIETVLQQINALNTELVSVKMQLQYIEKYKIADAFVCLTDLDKHNLIAFIAPIVYMDDTDKFAKRFDNFMYGMMIAQIEGSPQFKKGKKQLINVCTSLSKRATIPQVKEKLELINTIDTDEFWQSSDILDFDKVKF